MDRFGIGCLTALANGSKDPITLSKECGYDQEEVKALLDYLVSLKVLDHQEGKYKLTSIAAAFLLPGSLSYAGDLVLGLTEDSI